MTVVAIFVAYRYTLPVSDLASKVGVATIGATQAMFLGVVVVGVAVKMAKSLTASGQKQPQAQRR
jgi:glutamate/tyrosine decarboxylase-like PLP-dependent enzyme